MSAERRLSWKEVRERIHARILAGRYSPGDKLPRDEDFAAEMGCARATVQRAMRDLAEAGIVERVRKGGTHLRRDPVTRAVLEIPVARREVEERGGSYGYQLIAAGMAEVPRAVRAAFGLAVAEPMLRVEALHLSDRRPYIYEDRWICTGTVPEIAEVDLSRISANEWLVHNRPYSRCDLRFYARKASEYDARLLECEPGEALLVMERTTWIGEAPITSVRAVTGPGYQLLTRI